MESKNELVRKEQCPVCAKNGKDTSKDNLAVYSDGQTHCFACNKHGFVEHEKKAQVEASGLRMMRSVLAEMK